MWLVPQLSWGRKHQCQHQQQHQQRPDRPGEAGWGCAEGKLQIWVKLPGGGDKRTHIPPD